MIDLISHDEKQFLIIKGVRKTDQMPLLIVSTFNVETLKVDIIHEVELLNSKSRIDFCSEPGAKLYKQNGEFIYYYKIENIWQDEKEYYNLMKYSLSTRTETRVTRRSFYMHSTINSRGEKILKGSLCCVFSNEELE